jgi:hypothetical protein
MGIMTIASSRPSDRIIFGKDGTLSGRCQRFICFRGANMAALAQADAGLGNSTTDVDVY